MKYTQIIFSPTGGTKAAAAALCSSWEGEARIIDLVSRSTVPEEVTIDPEEFVLIAMPVYSGRIPALAAQRLSSIRGNGAKCAIAAVYGNRAFEDALVEMQDLAEGCGFNVCAAATAIAEHSIVRSVAKGRPDEEDKGVLAAFGSKILEKLKEGTPAGALPGNRPYKPGPSGPNLPDAGKNCVRCCTCQASCPAGAIEGDMKSNPAKCIGCMRCIAVCPFKVRKLPTETVERISGYLAKACPGRAEPELFL